MKKLTLILGFLVVFSCFVLSQGIEDISSEKAFRMTQDPSTYLIDVRSIAEYVFVGHPEMAYNIPLGFWSEEEQKIISNDNFLEDIKSHFKKEDKLIFICRSGGRSLRAAKLVLQAGFSNAFNINEGFEGKKDEKGYRTVDGWKNSGLPYSYELKDKLIYQFKK